MSTQAFNPETGEVIECRECQALRDVVTGLERDIRAWTRRYADLARDRELEARTHSAWDEAVDLFAYWQRKCAHPKSRFSAERFWLVEPLLREYGPDLCRRAIDGAAYDCFKTTRRNGSVKRHDDFDLIFRDGAKLEDFVNRAPREKP